MCFTVSMNVSAFKIAARFGVPVNGILHDGPGEVSGFSHPSLPVLNSGGLEMMRWGLVPHWVKNHDQAEQLRKKTLNARAETIRELPSFRDARPAVIPVNSFFEWHHNDDGTKTKYELLPAESDLFMLGGLWTEWIGPESGRAFHSFTIITVPANPLMAEILNSKLRMPLILNESSINLWLHDENQRLMVPCSSNLIIAEKCSVTLPL